ncbi:MAG TPA: haloacid dehalogenase-like hydrolase [Solirubrobacteraceae bacterium]|nr:haloacid dehalogenase-like hydrolase [Solirubrobacteraceae bacterium]
MLLLLFDIDGTLVAGATEAHREALHRALREVHRIPAPETLRPSVDPAGRTDGEIARLILLLAGVPARDIDDGADAVREACCREYARLCPPDLSRFVLPGVPSLLESFSADERFALALLTGNFEPIARLKLARAAGLGKHFPSRQGAFGSDTEDRTELPAIARRRAGRAGAPFPRKRTVVIGDTPLDIACARADGVHAVAVATGPYDVRDLGDADAVAADASELAGVLRALAA